MRYFILLWSVIFSMACQNKNQSDASDGKPLVVCTTGMVGDLVKNIAGGSLEVKSLMGPGVDPHLYKATQGDLTLLRKADFVVYNGLHLEGKMTEILENFSKVKSIVALSDFIDKDRIIYHGSEANIPDPHIWFDVDLWSSAIPGLTSALCELSASDCDAFKKRSLVYQASLDSLNTAVADQISRIPEAKRILVTAHDAFEYFGRAYNIEVRGLQGISTLSEFGLKDRIELIDFIVEKGINSVFVESSVSKKNIEAIVEGCTKKGHPISIGGSLYSDAMGDPAGPEGHYIGMVNANVQKIVSGLLGKSKNDS